LSRNGKPPLPILFGCAGTELSAGEQDFFRAVDPLGFILFKRNCADPAQAARLVESLRDVVRRGDAPVLIDQEGGRVARLAAPHWPAYPAPARIAALGGAKAEEAARLGARLIADDLFAIGISVDCFPLLDLGLPNTDAVIGDRAWSDDPAEVARLGRAACHGLLDGGILPIVKHIPGHGRATVDSHRALPRVTVSRAVLEETDFAPFCALGDMPWAMTAHIIYEAVDSELPATLSPRVIAEIIRGSIGFEGVLVSDDLSMGALQGGFAARARAALDAGCDLILHCNAHMKEMFEIAEAVRPLSDETRCRLAEGEAKRLAPQAFDRAKAEATFQQLLATP
jgi:beta-N-acetylhexosaminidase